jgi:hypothetical protein
VLERWTWRRCAELTVEQYREVLAMPDNVEKLRRNGRLTVGARSVSRQANCDQIVAGADQRNEKERSDLSAGRPGTNRQVR